MVIMKSAKEISMDENHPLYKAIDRGGGQTCDIGGVIQALLDAGYVIVPREPTDNMDIAGNEALPAPDGHSMPDDFRDAWRAAVDAALKAY